jgi:endonuclease/exonuclease/phosphatase family metal-dependent hydrolase
MLMRRFLLPFLTLIHMLAGNCNASVAQCDLKVMSYNIRYDNPNDGKSSWEKRKDQVITLITDLHPDIIGIQEALHNQVLDLQAALTDYSYYGQGRDDGAEKGEYCAVFYRTNRFDAGTQDVLWLSENPEAKGSMGWDAACVRIQTRVVLTDQKLSTDLLVVNTHFDHQGVVARRNGAASLLETNSASIGSMPTIVLGDFNAEPDDEVYAMMTEKLIDARASCMDKIEGPEYTYTGFKVDHEVPKRIDYIFINESFKVTKFLVDDRSIKGRYPSDHLPVVVCLELVE